MTDIVVIDIETANNFTALGETTPWSGQIIGIGICTGKDFDADTKYYSGEGILEIVQKLSTDQTPLVAYNTLFEVSWLTYHFEEYPLNWQGDAALYAIALDNSADSFSLKDAALRLLNYEPWELVVQNYAVVHFKCAASQWGKYIPKLPFNILQDYCRKDCHATWLLWQKGHAELDIDYIHEFFMAEVKLTAEAYVLGTAIDREKAGNLLTEYQTSVQTSTKDFLEHPELRPHIEAALRSRYEKKLAEQLAASKTGKVKPQPYEKWLEKNPFNPGSTSQLEAVFRSQKLFWHPTKLIHEWPETTPKGKPCLDADHLFMYGVGGKILAETGELKAKVNKLKMIMRDSEHEGRAHFDINLCSVRSTRVSSNGLNIVATPLDNEIGECFIADEGWSFFLFDFASLEPTVSAMLTKDAMLSYCSYHGEGVRPFWKNGILQIDDTYLCYLSATKRWGDEIRSLDPDEWLADPEKVKKKFKTIRQAGKKLVLMTGYGSGIEKVCLSIYKELGIQISIKEGKELINTLWAVFPEMYRYIVWLKAQVLNSKPIHTWLGFPITPSKEIAHCVFNYRVQTEAQHVMKQYIWQLQQRREKWFVPSIVNIHDASCFLVHDDKIEEFKKITADGLADLNQSLELFTNGIKFRIASHVGKTLREAKEG